MTHNFSPPLDLAFVRQQFPSLAGDWIFFDNAGGSQILKPVVDRITAFLYESNVQLGASYALSQRATERVAAGAQAMATLVNAADPAEVVLGPSTSALLRMLAQCFRPTLQPGDEIVVTNADHEANISPWVELERAGMVVKFWRVNPTTLELDLADLEALLTSKTRLVAVTHTSNVLGSIQPVRAIADLVHSHGALLCVDGVAFAPHRRVDVQALDVDFYTFSLYKVYGPHMALLYGKKELLLTLPGYNHYFIDDRAIPYKFQPGDSSYELSYSLTAITDYFTALGQHHGQPGEADPIDQAFALIQQHEAALNERLLSFLHSRPRVRVIGRDAADPTQRVSTISFVVEGVSSDQIPPRLDSHNIAIRYGHFYALRLIEALGLLPQQGVVRVSMVHYNTLEECDRLIEQLENLL
ncbi:cysteine desulfurase-like protein [Nodosilinea sp. PGN35]|uniref:cysteine desulfurase-like protein n=1 Tax=Nodosilinea sp. PGN35 TaxID=3020489 RepID=UPI0023B31FAF|nr:cysteine desulfurase-like protein [Nodosilinea sp. TSF1-S3]MDF0366252.1 cysteine desulfurase-like protein [Nodosilinea sp. TSF1-S3]